MNEILKKRIDKKLKRAENRLIASEQPYDAKFLAAVHELVIRATEFALKNQWISVDEALPEEDPDCTKWLLVLVRVQTEEDSTRDILQLGLYCGNGKFSCETRNIKAVAWMPIPEMEE